MTSSPSPVARVFNPCSLLLSIFFITPALAATDPLLDSLDLSLPTLAPVKQALDANDLPAARHALASYYRTRTNIHYDPQPPKDLTTPEQKIADDSLAHRFTCVNIPWQFPGPIDWRFNPTAPPNSLTALNHEWTWQFNRHYYWPSLAHAYHSTHDRKYADELCSEILSWTSSQPMPPKMSNGPYSTWRTIEAGIRMFSSWPETFFTMAPDESAFPDNVLLAMVDSMRQHAIYLDAHFTAGNWKTMESNGLFHVATLFPEFRDSPQWRSHALSRQHDELSIQVYPDGFQKELTPGYHNVALNSFVGTLKLALANHIPVPPDYASYLEKMYDVNLKLTLPDRTTPNFNDSGRINTIKPLHDALQLFPNHPDWQFISTNAKTGHPPEYTSTLLPYAGIAIMRSSWDRNAIALALDAGPFGTGHQHEDKLNFILDAYGSHLLAECGTFTYDASDMRHYALSADAHNLISVDHQGQNRRSSRETLATNTPMPINWITTPDTDYAEASFGKLPGETWGAKKLTGFVHTRRILFVKPAYFVVLDTLIPPDKLPHTYSSCFHLDANTADYDPATGIITTKNPAANLTILSLMTPNLSIKIIKGQQNPFLGWISDKSYDQRPVPTPYYTLTSTGPTHFLYAFSPSDPTHPSPIISITSSHQDGSLLSAALTLSDGTIDTVSLMTDASVLLKRSTGQIFSTALSDAAP